ncbi:MAG: 5'/3'-nucleotidase SurE [Gammaproteobacteria bacterium]|nr:5'/3'-nucleotidase SurE [Gammaproteobacteria bacterium]
MKILVSNDDGYRAPGIKCLVRTLEQLSEISSVTVVAPDRERSGASNSLTLEQPLRAVRAKNGFVSVNGTPTDCVHLAITGLLEETPDMVISGINAGSNLGDDVLYSGTVAAAMEGRFLGLPALAVSLTGEQPRHYQTAAKVVESVIKRLNTQTLPANTILNINVPDLPREEIAGMEATRLGQRHKSEPVIKSRDPRGMPIYWVGPPGKAQDNGPGTDFNAIERGVVSITPLHVDLTHYPSLKFVANWLNNKIN